MPREKCEAYCTKKSIAMCSQFGSVALAFLQESVDTKKRTWFLLLHVTGYCIGLFRKLVAQRRSSSAAPPALLR